MTKTRANIDVALDLARAGYHVFPCHAGGDKAKSPMNPPIMSWRKQSSDDVVQVQRWWSSYPQAAIGLDLGKSSLVVIDCDRHGADDGVHNFGAMIADLGHEFDFDIVAATPNQGTHIFFRMPHGETHGNGRGALPPGVDVRGEGGYVIAPGTTMQDGRIYEVFGSISDAPVCPSWIWDILKTERRNDKPHNNLPATSKSQNSLKSSADHDEIAEMLGYISPDLHHDEWVEVLMAIHSATGGGTDGLALADQWSSHGAKYKGRRETEAKWRSFKGTGVNIATLADHARRGGADLSAIAIKYRGDQGTGDANHGADLARQLVKARDGSVHDAETGEIIDEGHGVADGGDWSNPGGLIGDIADWITETAPLPNYRLSLAAAISFVSLVCSRHRETPGFAGGLQLFTICTGSTGIGKDWPMKAIDRLALECGLGLLIKSGKLTTSLALEREITTTATQLILADEVGRRIFGKAGHKRASTYESAMTDLLLELWSCNPVTMFRTTSRAQESSTMIEGPAVSLFGVSTHRDFYTSIGRASVDNGMINRLLVIEADKRAKLRSIDGSAARTPPDHILSAVNALKPPEGVTNGLSEVMGVRAYMAQQGVKPRPVPWGQNAAQTRWEAFREEMLDLSDRNEETAPFVSRAAEMALRLACLHTLSRFGPDGVVLLDAVEWAIAVVTDSCRNAIEGVDEYIVTSDFQEHVKRVERIIRANRHVKKSIIARRLGGSIDNRTLESVLAHLVLAGKISEAGQRGSAYRWN